MTPKQVEKEFIARIKARCPYAFIQRLYDSSDINGLNKGKAHGFTQPSDFVVTDYAGMRYAEVKACGNKTSFPLSNIRKGQVRACLLQTRAGGAYTFYIYNTNEKQWYKLNEYKFNQLMKAGQKSIKWKDLELWT